MVLIWIVALDRTFLVCSVQASPPAVHEIHGALCDRVIIACKRGVEELVRAAISQVIRPSFLSPRYTVCKPASCEILATLGPWKHQLTISNRTNRLDLFTSFFLLTDLKWAGFSWEKVMSHAHLHQSGFNNILNQNVTTIGCFVGHCQSNLICYRWHWEHSGECSDYMETFYVSELRTLQ